MATSSMPNETQAVTSSEAPGFRPFAGFAAAVRLLTIIPFGHGILQPVDFAWAAAWFPLVGLIVGGFLLGVDWLAGLLWPGNIRAAWVLLAWVVVTGALHLDGFLDSIDGVFGGRTPAERLRILRDEHVGAFAVVAAVLLLLLKFAALSSILTGRWAGLLLAPILGRWSMTIAVWMFPYARAEGLGSNMKHHMRSVYAFLAAAIAVSAAVLLGRWPGIIALGTIVACTMLGGSFAARRLGGLTGDIYGALNELNETLVLLVFAAEWPT